MSTYTYTGTSGVDDISTYDLNKQNPGILLPPDSNLPLFVRCTWAIILHGTFSFQICTGLLE